MGKPFVRNTLDTTIENQIAIAAIVSTRFLVKLLPVYDPEYIVNDYVRKIVSWVIEYFREYEIAPHTNIKAIYEVEKYSLEPAEGELIASVLSKLSSEYASGEGINEDYIFDSAISYFEKRDVTIRLERAIRLRDAGRWEEVSEALERKPSLEKALSKWGEIFDYEAVANTYNRESYELMSMPGALGELLGPIERGYFIGIIGGFKRGKTMYMLEFAAQAIFSKLKVAFISFEMTDRSIKDRIYKRLTGFGDGSKLFYPIMDCLSNQLGTCGLPQRRNTKKLRMSIKDPIQVTKGYSVCTVCRGGKGFIPEVYYEEDTPTELTVKNVTKSMRGFEMMFGNRFRYLCYPRFSASYDDIERDLKRLEIEYEFIPDVLIVDYANIMKPGKYSGGSEKRNVIDDNWMNLARIAGEKHCVVVTGGQGNRASLSKGQLEEEDIAEWIGILGHVDMMLALNQLTTEKEAGKIRISLLAHRHKNFNPETNIVVLQKLDLGQTLLDSEFERR